VEPADRVEQVRAFNRFYTRVIGVLGDGYLATRWTVTEARIVFELATSGETTVAELRRRLDLDRGHLSRIMAAFESAGIVRRDRDPHDARLQRVKLTAAGQREFKVLNRRSARGIETMLARHSEAEQAALVSAMATIRRVLDDEQADDSVQLAASAETPAPSVTVHLLRVPSPRLVYAATVLFDDGDHIVVRAPWQEPSDRDAGYVRFDPGDEWTEHYWRSRWYSVKEIQAADGGFKGWYCDVTRPLQTRGDRLYSEDLYLDVWVSADGRTVLRLDEDEFEARGFAQSDPATYTAALAALGELERRGATLYGISVDSSWCHRAFREREKLTIPLLSDFEPKGEVARRYGMYLEERGHSARGFVVVAPDGTVKQAYRSPTPLEIPGANLIFDALAA
jgi:DNA-binding MarR family transcriptional regulator